MKQVKQTIEHLQLEREVITSLNSKLKKDFHKPTYFPSISILNLMEY